MARATTTATTSACPSPLRLALPAAIRLPQSVLVVELETVQAGSPQPLMSPCGQVHREVDVSPQRSEPSSVEPAYGSDVASDGADGKVLVTTGESLLDDPADEPAAYALIPSCLCDDDRLDFGTRTLVEQAGETDDRAAGLGHPGSDPLRRGEIAIESRSRVVSTDRRVPIDTSVVLRQLCPQGSTSVVVAFGVVANGDLRRGWRARLPRNRHRPILPGGPYLGCGLSTWPQKRKAVPALPGLPSAVLSLMRPG
jgi:hypothetical protein